jgi:hypothetical protein
LKEEEEKVFRSNVYLATVAERLSVRMMETLVEGLAVGKTVGAPIAGLEKKLLCCCCCSWMKWRREGGKGDA